jgi:hypothetical protein
LADEDNEMDVLLFMWSRVIELQPILLEPTVEDLEDTKMLGQLVQVEQLSKLRREAVTENIQQFCVLYETRRQLFVQLDRWDSVVEDGVKPKHMRNRARKRRGAEEASLRNLNEQIVGVEAYAIYVRK